MCRAMARMLALSLPVSCRWRSGSISLRSKITRLVLAIRRSNVARYAGSSGRKGCPAVSSAVCTPLARASVKNSVRKSICRSGSADRDAALFAPVVAVAVYPLEQRFCRPRLAALCPCFGVVAVLAPQGTPLQKHHKAHAGAVHRAETFQRVDGADRLTGRHGRCGR